MATDLTELLAKKDNFIFLGEAGSGKSEIAINLACFLAESGEKPVHFFDLDMTKPLFRSRDSADFLTEQGILVHFEKQFYDAPTVSGGVSRLLQDHGCYTVLDVGGDYIGARSVGGYAPLLNRQDTQAWYVINPYRPWSMDIEHVDKILSQILGVSHVNLETLHILGNPNLGPETLAEEVLEGANVLEEMISPYKPVELYAVREDLFHETSVILNKPTLPLHLTMTYEWLKDDSTQR